MRVHGLLLCLVLLLSIGFGERPAGADSFQPVAPIKQPTRMSCWAAAATMLVSWKEQRSLEIATVVDRAGPRYRAIFDDPTSGIYPADETAFYRALGLQVEVQVNPSLDGWDSRIRQYGPLSVTVDSEAIGGSGKVAIHALVVTGIRNVAAPASAMITYIDPGDGKEYDVKFTEFLKLYEGASNWPLQIIHY